MSGVPASSLREIEMRADGEMIEDPARNDRVRTTVVDRGLLVRCRVMTVATATWLIVVLFVVTQFQAAARRRAPSQASPGGR